MAALLSGYGNFIVQICIKGTQMKLPNADKAVVPSDKITNYLLSLTHPDGQDKAVFFTSFGFMPEKPEQLENALLRQAISQEIVKSVPNVFGVRYVLEGLIETPDGRSPLVRSVWFIEKDDVIPRLVTAYPL